MIPINFSDYRVRIVILALLLLPPFIVGLYIAMFGVNVIYWDQWSFPPVLQHWYDHSLSFMDLFAQHNEHRIFFPQIIMLGIAVVTSYNTVAEMACSYLLLLLNYYLVFRICLGGKPLSWQFLASFIPVAWLVCSLHQWENLLWGFQVQVFLCVTGVLLAVLFLGRCRGSDWNLALGVSGGVISSFSFMNGLMVWPAGLVLLLLKEKRAYREIFLWLAASGITALVFFSGWVRPAYHPSPFYFFSRPLDALGYFLVINTNALGFSPENAGKYAVAIAGVLYLFILGFVLYHTVKTGRTRMNARAVALVAFAILTELMLTVGRGGFGIGQAAASRYVTFTVLGVIGIYLLFLQLKESPGENSLVRGAFFVFWALIVAGILLGTMGGIIKGEAIREQRQEMRENLLEYATAPDSALKTLFPDPAYVRYWAPFLQKNHLNVFSGG